MRVLALGGFFGERGELRTDGWQSQRLTVLNDTSGLKFMLGWSFMAEYLPWGNGDMFRAQTGREFGYEKLTAAVEQALDLGCADVAAIRPIETSQLDTY
jgi:hypothetical protein